MARLGFRRADRQGLKDLLVSRSSKPAEQLEGEQQLKPWLLQSRIWATDRQNGENGCPVPVHQAGVDDRHQEREQLLRLGHSLSYLHVKRSHV